MSIILGFACASNKPGSRIKKAIEIARMWLDQMKYQSVEYYFKRKSNFPAIIKGTIINQLKI